MIYSVNRVELALDCTTEKLLKLQNKAYCVDYTLANDGFEIEYRDSTYKKKVKLIVHPNTLLGGDANKSWKPDTEAIQKLLRKLDKYIGRCFGSKYNLDNFTLTGIDIAADIDVCSSERVSAYIKVLRNIGKVKWFSPKPKKYKEDSNTGCNDSFGLFGNSNGIEFIVYDKEASYKGKDFKGLLRAEVRLVKQKIIRKYADSTSTSQQLECLAANSREIFLDTFVHIVPYGDFYKKNDVVKIIVESDLKRKSKAKMLRLLELIPKKKSLYLAQKAMNERDIEKIMSMFYKLNISPITISKRQDVAYLETLYLYLLDE